MERLISGPLQGDVLHWNTDQQFDITIAIGVLDYIAQPLSRLKAIRKLTSGMFLSAWPRFWTWRMPIRKVRLSMSGCPVYFFRRSHIFHYLSEAGFIVESWDAVGQLYCVKARPSPHGR